MADGIKIPITLETKEANDALEAFATNGEKAFNRLKKSALEATDRESTEETLNAITESLQREEEAFAKSQAKRTEIAKKAAQERANIEQEFQKEWNESGRIGVFKGLNEKYGTNLKIEDMVKDGKFDVDAYKNAYHDTLDKAFEKSPVLSQYQSSMESIEASQDVIIDKMSKFKDLAELTGKKLEALNAPFDIDLTSVTGANDRLRELKNTFEGTSEAIRKAALETNDVEVLNGLSEQVQAEYAKADETITQLENRFHDLDSILTGMDNGTIEMDTSAYDEILAREEAITRAIEQQEAEKEALISMNQGISAKVDAIREKEALIAAAGPFEKLALKAKEAFENIVQSSASAAEKVADSFKSIPSKMGNAAAGIGKGIINSIAKVPSMIGSAFKGIWNVAGGAINGLKGLFSGFGRNVESVGDSFSNLGSKVMKAGVMLLGARSVFYALRKAINTYLADNETVSNQINTIWATLGNAIGPVIDWLASKIEYLVNLISGLMSVLFGTTIQIKKATKATAGSAGASNAAAKAQERQLANFDEMNKLQDQSSGGGGGGGGGGGAGSGFELVDSTWKPWKELQDLIDAGDWIGVGEELATKVNEMLDAVDWTGWGTKLGKGLDKGIKIFYGFIENLNTYGLGRHIADFLMAAIENIDWGVVGRAYVRWKTMFLDLMIGFVSNLDPVTLGIAIRDFFFGACSEASEWLLSYDWRSMGQNLYHGLKTLVTTIDFASVARALFETLGIALGSLSAFILGFFEEALSDFYNKYLAPYFDQIDWNNSLWQCGLDLIAGFFKGIWDAICDVGNWIYENIFQPFIDGFKKAFGISSPSKVMKEQGGYIIEGLFAGISEKFANLKKKLIEIKEEIVKKFKEAWNGVKTAWSNAGEWFGKKWEDVKSAFKETKKWFGEKFSGAYSSVKEAWKGVGQWAGERWETIKGAFNTTKEWFGEKFSGAYTSATEAWNGAKESFGTTWENIKGAFSSTGEWFGTTFGSSYEKAKGAFNGSKSAFETIWDGIKSAFDKGGNPKSWFSTAFTNAFNAVKGSTDSMISNVQNAVARMKNALSGSLNNINMGRPYAQMPTYSYSSNGNSITPRVASVQAMATGGIVVRPTNAIVGEAGREAVLPLERNTEWMDALAEKLQGLSGSQVIVLQVDGREMARVVNDANKKLGFAGNY